MNKYVTHLFMTWLTYCIMNTEQTSKNIFMYIKRWLFAAYPLDKAADRKDFMQWND